MTGAVLFLHMHTISVLVQRWYHESDNTYGFFVPVLSAYLIWRNRDEILAIKPNSSLWGGAIIAASFLLQALGVIANVGYFQALSLVFLLCGIVLATCGKKVFVASAFPIFYLLLMIPLPGAVHSAIANPLQQLASTFSAHILELLRIPVFREGNVFRLAGISLEVAEACSGLRSLVGLLSMGILLGYLITPRGWERIFLALSTIPIAVAANILRVAGTGVIYEYVGAEYGQGFYHGFGAWIVFVIALGILLGEASLLSRLFGEDEPKPDDSSKEEAPSR
jgi:exosortase